MKTLSAFAVVSLASLFFLNADASAGDEAGKCSRTKFDTDLVKNACSAGGQEAAKKEMQAFVKQVKTAKKAAGEASFALVCQDCHTDIKKGGKYPLKEDGLKRFNDLKAFLDGAKK